MKRNELDMECILMLARMSDEEFENFIDDTIKSAGLPDKDETTIVNLMRETFELLKTIQMTGNKTL